MVSILGIKSGGHDSSAALIVNGRLIAAASEERFNRRKRSGDFPYLAINYCLSEAEISLSEVDYIAISWLSPLKCIGEVIEMLLKSPRIIFHRFDYVRHRFQHIFQDFRDKNIRALKKQFKSRVFHIKHSLSHASSSYRCSSFNKSIIISMDHNGEKDATLIARGDNGTISEINDILFPNSLGLVYRELCRYLGYNSGDEGKIMGLSAYGVPRIDVSNIFKPTDDGYLVNDRMFLGGKKYNSNCRFSKSFVEYLGKNPRAKNESIMDYADIASSFQKQLEKIIINLVEISQKHIDSDNICIAGGVGLNCCANGALLKSGLVKEIFIQPASGDDGTALGAAMELYHRLGYKGDFRMDHVYYGPSWENYEIKDILKQKEKKTKIKYYFSDDVAGEVAEMLSKGLVGGWFQGRMEWGPRALGNRSLLADPTIEKMKIKVNEIKGREIWRPLAPTILYENHKEYLENPYYSPFMTITFDVKEEKIKEIPAVVHVDGSTRPQILKKETNPIYYRLIKEFEKISGIPVILNTSLNIAGQPIACSPDDAIDIFINTNLDFLAIGNYLLTKPHR